MELPLFATTTKIYTSDGSAEFALKTSTPFPGVGTKATDDLPCQAVQSYGRNADNSFRK